MERRDFLTGACVAGTAMAAMGATAEPGDQAAGREYYEMRTYQMGTGGKKKLLTDFIRKAAIPAWNRLGIENVGVFNSMFGGESQSLRVLLPHKSLASFASASSDILADKEFLAAAEPFLDASMSDPGFVRFESSLLAAFTHMPQLKAPKKRPRIFELRTYESHSMKKAKKKIEMFNEGGEIQVFLDVGMHPVFFGETLIGPDQPNLVYMLAFRDMAEREKLWSVFGKSDGWRKLSGDPQYAETVSNIAVEIMRPSGSSQI